ncbi:hypothetical protein G9C98_005710 [Cotesia typhae]|uniref:Uncharacterized protein n=1 Tax=Cotesia typhae TaxID=2053667 RepID=A0A8J5UUM5_9HYME|nr:hypothetical protein G9C98_005710 [Cotesia typhae]
MPNESRGIILLGDVCRPRKTKANSSLVKRRRRLNRRHKPVQSRNARVIRSRKRDQRELNSKFPRSRASPN